MPTMLTELEQIFSQAKLTITLERNRMTDQNNRGSRASEVLKGQEDRHSAKTAKEVLKKEVDTVYKR
jgi:hypothetical protein